VGRQFDGALAAALEKSPAARAASARVFREALEEAAKGGDQVASHAEVGAVVRALAADALEAQRRVLQDRLHAEGPPTTRRSGPAVRAVVGLGGHAHAPLSAASLALEATSTSGAEETGAPTARIRVR
jgi:hypothetical protein